MRRRHWKLGLTVLEVIIVTAIISITSVMLVPALIEARERGRQEYRLQHPEEFPPEPPRPAPVYHTDLVPLASPEVEAMQAALDLWRAQNPTRQVTKVMLESRDKLMIVSRKKYR